MNAASPYCRFFLLILLAGLLAIPLTALAEDGDPDGTRLKALLQDPKVVEKMPENLKAGETDYYALCGLEELTVAGAIIWGYRLAHDKCPTKGKWESSMAYCVKYSLECDHYKWNPGCMSDKEKCP